MTQPPRALLALWLSALALLLVPTTAAPAMAQEPASVKIREAVLDDDGTVTLTIQPVGAGAERVTAEQLLVTEGGRPVEDLTVTPLRDSTTRPVVAALVIDTSGSMRGPAMDATKAAATSFVERLASEGVRTLVVAFSDAPRVVTPATTDPGPVVRAIAELEADGETALYDAIVLAANELRQLDAQPNLVVFSDGGDTASTSDVGAAIRAAEEASVPITAVSLVTEESDPEALGAITQATGGSVLAAGDLSGLQDAFGAAATEITTQYVVTYRGERTEARELDIAVAWTGARGAVDDAVTVVNTRTAPPSPLTFYTRSSPGLLGSSAGLVLGIAAVALAAFLVLSLLLARPGNEAAKVLDRELSAYIQGSPTGRVRSSASVAQALRARAEALVTAAPRPTGFDERLQHRLDQAAWPLRTSEFLTIQAGAGLVLALLGFFAGPWWAAVPLFAIGAWVPWLVLDVQRNRRRRAFLSRFPDTLQLLAGSLRAGYGIVQAMDAVGRESGPPTSEEFSRALTESRLGAPLEDALDGIAERLDSEDVRWVVLAIKIQREVGGNLAELLTTVAATLREREALRRQIAVLSAEGRLSAIILIVLPFLLGGYLTLANPDYVRVLVETTIGWFMVGGATVMMAIGVVWIRRMIRIEV